MCAAVARGLYSLTPDPTWQALAVGGVLLGGPESALGMQTAGFLHGLCDPPHTLDVFAPRRMMDRGRWRFHIGSPRSIGSPCHTTIDSTALYLASQGGVEDAINVLAKASDRRTTPSRLVGELDLHPNLKHRALLREVLHDVDQGAHSALERRYLRDVERAHGLPVASRQMPTGDRAIVDCAYQEWELIVELDGRRGHFGTGKWRDATRDNRHTLRLWRTLRFGWADVAGDPCTVARIVATMPKELGWTGELSRCSACG